MAQVAYGPSQIAVDFTVAAGSDAPAAGKWLWLSSIEGLVDGLNVATSTLPLTRGQLVTVSRATSRAITLTGYAVTTEATHFAAQKQLALLADPANLPMNLSVMFAWGAVFGETGELTSADGSQMLTYAVTPVDVSFGQPDQNWTGFTFQAHFLAADPDPSYDGPIPGL